MTDRQTDRRQTTDRQTTDRRQTDDRQTDRTNRRSQVSVLNYDRVRSCAKSHDAARVRRLSTLQVDTCKTKKDRSVHAQLRTL